MSADGPALLRAVIEHPDDVARRLVYADHLQQQGDPQGELIAIQCRLASLDPHDPARPDLEARTKALMTAHGDAWSARIGPHVRKLQYRLGLACAAQLPARLDAWTALDRAPIRDIVFIGDPEIFNDDDDDDPVATARHAAIAEELALDPRLGRIETLGTGVGWGELGLSALLASRHLTLLRGLKISDIDSQPFAGRALERAHLPALEMLAVCGDYEGHFGDEGTAAIARAQLPALRELYLLNVDCNRASAEALAASTTITQLHGLDLGWGSYNANQIGPDGTHAIAMSRNVLQLKRLVLDHNRISNAGLAALARSPHLGALRSLAVKACAITDAGLVELASSTGAPQLELLELSYNEAITSVGVIALAESPRLATLTSLWLRRAALDVAAARALAISPHTHALRSLNLLECKLGDAGARALLESPNLEHLTELQLNGNQIVDEGLKTALRARWPASVR